jgi:signal transduction histidine kinase
MDFLRTGAALALQGAPYVILILYAISRFIRQATASFFYGFLIGITGLAALLLPWMGGQAFAGTTGPAFSTGSARLGMLSLLCAIFTLFLLARHLTALAGWLQWSLTALFLLTALLLLTPAAFRLTTLLFLMGACALPFVFWRQSQRFTGATRKQVQWLGVALLLLLAHLLLLSVADLLSLGAVATSWATFFLFLGSGIALYLGFVPPRWLWNFWQAAEQARISQLFDLHLLGGTQPTSSLPPDHLTQRLDEVLRQAMRMLNCQAGVIERWNETAGTLEALASASATTLTSPREALALKNGRLCEAFTQQQVIAAPLDTEHRFLRWSRSSGGVLLAAPILANSRTLGVMGLACERPPLFPNHHLALLRVFAQQVALWLVYFRPPYTTTVALEQIAQEQREKDEFIAVMVHELRSPLTVLKGRLQLLKRKFAKDQQASAFEAVSRLDPQLRRLEELIDTVVDVSYLDAGRFRLNQEPLDLAALIDEAMEQHKRLCTAHTLVLERKDAGERRESTSDHSQPLRVLGDASRLTQVLHVLLNQACQATPAGDLLTVRLERSDASGEAIVQVQDRGAGIPPEKQAQVFQRQVRHLTGSSGQVHGTGLEIYISHEIVRYHGGRMWLESSGVPGEGAAFSFALPLLSPQEAASTAAPSQAPTHTPGLTTLPPERESTRSPRLPLSADQAGKRKTQLRQEITNC